MKYRISTPARLHFGLINQSGLYNRCNGGFGVSISDIFWDIEVSYCEKLTFTGIEICEEHKSAIKSLLKNFNEYTKGQSIIIKFYSIIKPHCGLGSKTSLLLSVAKLVNLLFNLELNNSKLVEIVGRGGTSGVGINIFEEGGLVVDNGHNYETNQPFSPSSISRLSPAKKLLSLKNDYFKIVFFRFTDGVLFGNAENNLFKDNCPVNHEDTKDIVCSLFFQIIPAFIENNNDLLQKGMKEVQVKGFKKIEWEHQSAIERAFYEHWNKKNPGNALCLSSTGPGLFYIGTEIEKAIKTIESFQHKAIEICISSINNAGIKINKS